jgi:hypothetical protein
VNEPDAYSNILVKLAELTNETMNLRHDVKNLDQKLSLFVPRAEIALMHEVAKQDRDATSARVGKLEAAHTWFVRQAAAVWIAGLGVAVKVAAAAH